MSAARQFAWVGLGLGAGAVIGVLWGWFGGDYENSDSAIGTGFLCAMAGALVAVAALAVTGWLARRRRQR